MLTLITMGLSTAGCASTGGTLKQVSSTELPNIHRLERSLPVHVDVEGSRDRRTVVLAVPLPEPRLSEREKEILGESEQDQIDLFEFYVPNAGRSKMVSSYSGEVTVGYGGYNSVAAAGGYQKSLTAVSSRQGGVLVGHGPAVRLVGICGEQHTLTAIGGNGEVTVGYDRARHVGARERRRFYRR